MTENFWGDLPDTNAFRTPLSILREQSPFLADMTNGLLVGEVKIITEGIGELSATLYIVAPSLDNYRVGVLRIDHGLTIYPVTVTNLIVEAKSNRGNETDYISYLKEILSSDQIKKVITGLLVNMRSPE